MTNFFKESLIKDDTKDLFYVRKVTQQVFFNLINIFYLFFIFLFRSMRQTFKQINIWQRNLNEVFILNSLIIFFIIIIMLIIV